MIHKIKTVFGLPGVGKSTFCKERAYKGVGQGAGFWRPEPTEDITLLSKVLGPILQDVITSRFIALDTQPHGCEAEWRDSDVFTSWLMFGPPQAYPHNVWTPRVADTLVWLRTSQEEQARRILARGRESADSELMFCSVSWQLKAEATFHAHPAKHKEVYWV